MKMQKGIAISLFALLAVLVCVAEPAPATGIVGRTYMNEDYGFQISLPDDLTKWQITDKTGGFALVVMKGPAGARFQPNVNVLVEILPRELTSKEYFEAGVKSLRAFIKDFKEESRREVKVGDKDGYELIYTGRMFGIKFKWIQQSVVKGKYGYIITGTGVPVNFPLQEFRSIMSTFKFLSPSSVASSGKLFTTWAKIKAQ
ncbi:MAG TPA: hypothetical protein EYP60_00020 [bacterium (Candidatus Stahlbacteria)]|nr:hypothetical protein [Candidatus Stahlbacteria bacterium]